MQREPHPFARFIAILGRGKTLTRSLTIDEAEDAMAMIPRRAHAARAARRIPDAPAGEGGEPG